MSRVGEKIKEARLKAGMTQKALGKKLGVAEKFINEEEFHQPEAFLPLGRRLMVIPVPDESVQSDAEKAVSKPPVEHDR